MLKKWFIYIYYFIDLYYYYVIMRIKKWDQQGYPVFHGSAGAPGSLPRAARQACPSPDGAFHTRPAAV